MQKLITISTSVHYSGNADYKAKHFAEIDTLLEDGWQIAQMEVVKLETASGHHMNYDIIFHLVNPAL